MESLTSYLTRVAAENLFKSVNQFSSATGTRLGFQLQQPDTVPPTWGNFTDAVACSEARLLETTFFLLGAKFGRVDHKQRLGNFIGDSISQTLQFCPKCLEENGCYLLPWRFSRLKGCVRHNCRLIERCPECGEPVRLFGQPLRIAVCNTCGYDLCQCHPEIMDSEQTNSTWRAQLDLEYLLAPQPWKPEQIVKAIGPWMGYLRKEKRLTIAQVADQLDIDREVFKGIESPNPSAKRGQKLNHYFDYAAFLGVSMRELFELVTREIEDDPQKAEQSRKEIFEAALLSKVKTAAKRLEDSEQEVTQRAIGNIVAMSVDSLKHYPTVREYLESFTAPHVLQIKRLERENTFLDQAKTAVLKLRGRGEAVTQTAIGQEMGRAPEGFRLYERLYTYVLEVADSPQEIEHSLLERVRDAIDQLEAADQLVSAEAVGRIVGMTPEGLKKYVLIRPLIEEIAQNYQQHNQQLPDIYLDLVQSAEQELVANGLLVTQEAIAMKLAVAVETLKHHQIVRDYLKTLVRRYRAYNSALYKTQREAEFLQRYQSLFNRSFPVANS